MHNRYILLLSYFLCMIKLSIIIPAYNEQNTIIDVLEKVNEVNIKGVDKEIIVIDDSSTDDTLSLLEERNDLYSNLIRQKVNGGKGAAVKAGLLASNGEYILFQDADLEYDPNDYNKLIEPVLRFDADVVMGSRLVASQITRVSYFWHRIANKLITFSFNILNNTTFTDVYSCYLLYRSDLLDPNILIAKGWEQQAEILSNVISRGNNFYEVPINYYGRTYDEGKKIRAINIIAVFATIIRKGLFR